MTPEPEPKPFQWQAAMAFGLGVLRLPPSSFWAMTPRELDAALRGVYGPPSAETAPTRAGLAQLAAMFPD
jgi:uncharacterized phage protein (TIGR02216 family)